MLRMRCAGRGATTGGRMNAQELLRVMTDAIGERPDAGTVEFLGADPILPTPFLVGELGAAAIAASALGAARLFELRSGRAQNVRVAVDAASAAMRATRYLRSSTPPATRSGGGNGLYELADGRLFYFQRLFKHHVDRQLAVLGCGPSEEEISDAVRRWDGLELEEAVVAMGATGGFVRTPEEWAAHPQAAALSRVPLLRIERIGESDPVPLGRADRPLAGVRVLDLTRVLSGPTCGRTLAEHGADVLRVGTSAFPDNEQMMRDTGHGKRSVELDLKDDQGASTLRGLIAGADVFSQGYRPGAIAHLGFSPEEVAAVRPGIVNVSLSAFGTAGPWCDRRGFDSVVQAVTGIQHESAPGRRDRGLGASILDYATGYLAAFGAMVALRRRAEEGGSYLVEVSLAQTGRLLQQAGRADFDTASARPADLDANRIEELSISRMTPYGELSYLAPCAQLSLTPARWDLPTVPLDHDRPEWL